MSSSYYEYIALVWKYNPMNKWAYSDMKFQMLNMNESRALKKVELKQIKGLKKTEGFK